MQATLGALGDNLTQSLRDHHPRKRDIAYQMDGDLIGTVTIEGTFKEEPASDADYISISDIVCGSGEQRWTSPKVAMEGYIGVRFRVTAHTSGSAVLQTRVF